MTRAATLTISDNLDLNGPPLVEATEPSFGDALRVYNIAAQRAADRGPGFDGSVSHTSLTVDPKSGAITGLSFVLTDVTGGSLSVSIEEE